MSKELVVKNENAVATVEKKGNYITELIQGVKADFLSVNEGMDLDFVYLGSWLSVNSKGQFTLKDSTENFGDSIDVIIAAGEQRFTLWGKKGSDYEGQLIVAESTQEDAYKKFEDYAELDKGVLDEHSVDDIQSRYLAYIIFNDDLKEEVPNIYLLSLPMSSKLTYGHFARGVYSGAYKANGIPARTAVNQVVTRITTEEATTKNKDRYTVMKFEAVAKFERPANE